MNEFKKNRSYTCMSMCGLYPAFQDAEAKNDVYLEGPARIRTEKGDYMVRRNITGFRIGGGYECVSEDPLILEGEAVILPLERPKKLQDAEAALIRLLSGSMSACVVPAGIIRVIADVMEWSIEQIWDGTEQDLKDILLNHLESLIDGHGATNPAAAAALMNERRLFLPVFLPDDHGILLGIPTRSLPEELYVAWDDGNVPRCRLGDGRLLTEWFLEATSPEPGKAD